jgi:hypothetical protein
MELTTIQIIFLAIGAVLVGSVAYKLARRDAAALEKAITEAAVGIPMMAFLFWLDKNTDDWRMIAASTLLFARFAGSFAGEMVWRSSERRKAKAADAKAEAMGRASSGG